MADQAIPTDQADALASTTNVVQDQSPADQQLRQMALPQQSAAPQAPAATPTLAAQAPAAGSSTPFPPARGAPGVPTQAITVDSEPTQQITKPAIDPRPYAYFAQKDPEFAEKIDDVAHTLGINPLRLAAHKWLETRDNMDPNKRGAAGEVGPMQMLPSTTRMVDPTGRLDPHNIDDNLMLAGLLVKKLDARYGQDSPASIAAYNGNPRLDATQAYARKMLLGDVGAKDFATAGDSAMTPQGLVQSGVQGGPTGFLRYMSQTAPKGMPVSDQWNHAEDLLTSAFIAKGDLAGAQHARDFILQMSHIGSNQYLMAAHQALSNGDGVGAAQALAKAHAFFPDGTVGRFRTNGQQVWAERMDEHNPDQRVGQPFMVTPQGIAGLLNQTSNPSQYLQTVMAEQKAAAYSRHLDAMGQYYADLPQERLQAAKMRADSAANVAQIRGAATEGAAAIRAGGNQSQDRAIDKEVNDIYSPQTAPAGVDPMVLGRQAEAYKALRVEGMTGPQSQAVVKGLSDKTLHLLATTNGNFAIAGQDGKPVAYISRQAASSIFGGAGAVPQPGGPTPVGAGAATPYAMGAGIRQNLTGTVMPNQQPPVAQSSAIPVQ